MVDKQRAKKFREDMAALQRELKFGSRMAVIQDKLLDYLARTKIEPKYLRELINVIEPNFRPEFQKFINDTLKKYNNILDIVNDYYSDLGVDIQRDFSRIKAIEIITRARMGEYEQKAIREIARQLRKGLLDKKSYKKIAKDLAKVGEKVSFYSETIARTQVKAYGQAAVTEKANIAQVFAYEYIGIIRRNTRLFCRHTVGKTLHIDDIRRMRNGQLEPVITYRGGWNCHHDWEPDPFVKVEPGQAGTLTDIDLPGNRSARVFI